MADVPAIPTPRAGEPLRIALVCLGNICRSAMAHTVLADKLATAGLTDRVALASAGTGPWHAGKPMDDRAASALRGAGYDPTRHRAQQCDAGWLADHDLILVMDHTNLDEVRATAPGVVDRVHLFGAFDPQHAGAEVPDPYYGSEGGFARVLDQVQRTADALVEQLR